MLAHLRASLNEIGVLDLQLQADPPDLIVLADDHRLVGRRDREETPQQAESLLEGRKRRELTRHDQVVRAADATELVEREGDDRRRFARPEQSLIPDEPHDHLALFGADRVVGVGDPAEQVRERRHIPRAAVLQPIQHACNAVDDIRRVRRPLDTEPFEEIAAYTHLLIVAVPYRGFEGRPASTSPAGLITIAIGQALPAGSAPTDARRRGRWCSWPARASTSSRSPRPC